MRKFLEPLAMPILKKAASRYVTGDTVEDALNIATDIHSNGHGVTICYWHSLEETADQVESQYADAVKKCHDAGLDFHLAVKVPAFDKDLTQVTKIVENVRKHGGSVDFDAHAPEQADDVLTVAKSLGGEALGLAIPGRWHRSIEDADRAIELGLRIRVVKGGWPDPDEPNMDLRAGYLNVVDAIAGRAREVGVATHDDWLIQEVLKRLQNGNSEVEQELLYGLPMKSAETHGFDAGVPLRVYVPYGSAWFPYSVSKAMTDPRRLK
ncbi:MAG: proline dehydrogenase, partial [Acidimicrobiales bacterium]